MVTRHIIDLLKSHVQGDRVYFRSVAMKIAADEARKGHSKTAEMIRDIVDEAKQRGTPVEQRSSSMVVLPPRGEVADLISTSRPEIRLPSLVLPPSTEAWLKRVIEEQRQQTRLRQHNLPPRRKLLFMGPPGTGKSATAEALAAELDLPLFTILTEVVVNGSMGETPARLRLVVEAMGANPGVYLFPEFDAVDVKRTAGTGYGQTGRTMNLFRQLLAKHESDRVIIAATNHPDLMDQSLFKGFDDVLEFSAPDEAMATRILQARLVPFDTTTVDWSVVRSRLRGLRQADLARAAIDAAKSSILNASGQVQTADLVSALEERSDARTRQTTPSQSQVC